MECQRFLVLDIENPKADCLQNPKMWWWPPLKPKTKVTHSLPHSDNECQQSINNISSSIFLNHTGDWFVNMHK